MYKYLILIFICAVFFSCDNTNKTEVSNKTDKDNETGINTNTLSQKKIKGMYELKDSRAYLTDCETGIISLVAKDGDIRYLDSIYNAFNKKDLYIVAEGFNSVKAKQTGNEFDTVIVITKLIGADKVYNCLE